jgi:hypothetical protein
MTTNTLASAFADASSSLRTTGAVLDLLADRLTTVATRAEAERQRVASLLATLPAVPTEGVAGPFAEALGLGAAFAELVAARGHLDNHTQALSMLGAVATDQAEQVRLARAGLLAVTVPPVGPCVICGAPAQRDSLGVHACDTCFPLAPADAVPDAQEGQEGTTEPEPTPEPSAEPNVAPLASQETEADSALHASDNGAVTMPAEEVQAVCANPPAEPAPTAPLVPVAEDAAAPELPDAQRRALSVASEFFAAAEPGRRYNVKEVLPGSGYEGRDARQALRRVPASALAAAGIATDGHTNFWRI